MLDVKEAVGPVKEAAPEKVSKTRDIEKQRGYLVAPKFSPAQINLIRRMYAKGLDNDEFSVFIYIARAYGLDPIKGEISVHVRYADDPQRRQIIPIVGRDGFLTIAHRSGMFGGMKAGTKEVSITLPSGDKKTEIVGWASVVNKSYPDPVEVEAFLSEYNSGKNLWITKPRTMIQKVAESQALRRAFNISGIYDISEMDFSERKELPKVSGSDEGATNEQKETIKILSGTPKKGITKGEAAELIRELSNGENGEK